MTENTESMDQSENAIERPEHGSSEMMQSLGDESFIQSLKLAADNVIKVEGYMRQIIVACTHPQDWIKFPGGEGGPIASLGSAGAERLIKHMGVSFVNWDKQKLPFEDEAGQGYRWVYTCDVMMGGKTIKAQGTYGSRDKFLGSKNQEWRDISEINEGHIQTAAYRICRAEGIRSMLGIRKMPWGVLQEIMGMQGQDSKKTSDVKYDQGGQGGLNDKQRAARNELVRMMREMTGNDTEAMKELLIKHSSFTGSDGKTKSCDSIEKLTPKWIYSTKTKVEKEYKEWQAMTSGGFEPGEGT